MAQERFSRHLLAAFLLSVLLYVVGYWFIESRRVADGPWVVRFATNSPAPREIQIRQESMNLGPVTVRFGNAATTSENLFEEVAFDMPKPVPFDVPGGQCVFQDTTFLPGTVVLEIGGTTIQMLARTLTVGTNEFPWRPNSVIVVPDGETPKVAE